MHDPLSPLPADADASLGLKKRLHRLIPQRARRLGALAGVFLLLLGGAWFIWKAGPAGETEKSGAAAAARPGGPGGRDRVNPVVVEAAKVEDFPIRLTAIGTVVPRTIVTVRSRVDGTLNRLFFEEGQSVRAGDLLAEIDPRSFEVALTQAQGQLAKDQALLTNAQADLSRYESLARLDAIPAQQLDTQRALVRQYEGTVKVDQGAVDNARLQLSYTQVRAPGEGRVGLRQVDPGNLVRSSDANGIVVITQVQPVTVIFSIAEGDLGKLLVRLGMKERSVQRESRRKMPATTSALASGHGLPVEAWDRDGRLLLASGELLTVDNQIDLATGTVKVKAIFPNKDGALFPNQFVNVRLVVNELKDAVVIPAAAVQRGARGSFVWLLQEDQTISLRPVSVGLADGDRVPVVEGLASGDQVAVDGFDRLREGAKVEVVTLESRAVKAGPGKRGPRGASREAPAAPSTPAIPTTPGAPASRPSS